MSKFVKNFKSDAHDAAYRVAGKQITTGVKSGIVTMMKKTDGMSPHVDAMTAMLDTQMGEALIGYLAGIGLTYAPKISDDPRAQKLAEEFRVNGMATFGNAAIETAMEHFMPSIMTALQQLPEEASESKTRVDAVDEEDEEDEEDKEDRQEKKSMKTGEA